MKLFRPGGLELTDRAAALAQLKARQRVLDVGCGLGTSLEYLAGRFGIEPYGVDISQDTVRRAAKEYIIQGDACSLPYEDESFDAVQLECVLPLTAEPERALDEAARVLRDGGALAISGLSTGDSVNLIDNGRINFHILALRLSNMGFCDIITENKTDSLIQFVAEAIFEYGGLAEYSAAAELELGGSVLGCAVPQKGTGYMLLVTKKNIV